MKKLLLVLTLFSALQSNATHITGGQITSRCLGGFTQEVTLTLYRDIQGLPMSNTQDISYSSNNFNWNTFKTVSHQGAYTINPTTEAYDFVDTITVPYYDSYTVGYSTCCRPATLINITNPATTFLYLDLLFSVDTTCNSTPVIPVVPYSYATVNVPYTINIGASDPDGDSLSYQLTAPLDNPGSTVSYIYPSLATLSSNGILTFTLISVGTYDICFKVNEYRNGVLIGYVQREFNVDATLFNSIDELNVVKDHNLINYDLIGRKIR